MIAKQKRNFVVGDVQGCYDSLQRLLKLIEFNPNKDCIHFVGDVINRGPKSSEVAEWIMNHHSSVNLVLGNHELYFMACMLGILKPKPKDRLGGFLDSRSASLFFECLRKRTFLKDIGEYVIVHAGVSPHDTFTDSKEKDAALCRILRDDFLLEGFLSELFSTSSTKEGFFVEETTWAKIFCMQRIVEINTNKMIEGFSGGLHLIPKDAQPWFSGFRHQKYGRKIIFGHWAALGLHVDPNVVATDWACVWGGALAAFSLEQRRFFSVKARD